MVRKLGRWLGSEAGDQEAALVVRWLGRGLGSWADGQEVGQVVRRLSRWCEGGTVGR